MILPEAHVKVAAALIAPFEGCERRVKGTDKVVPYPDPVHGWKVPTVGYGVVCKQTDGPFTMDECQAMLLGKIDREYGPPVIAAVPWLIDDAPRFAACVSFAWNLGIGNFKASGMCAALKRRDYAAAAANCRKWVYAGGKVLPGLVRRRNAEAALIEG